MDSPLPIARKPVLCPGFSARKTGPEEVIVENDWRALHIDSGGIHADELLHRLIREPASLDHETLRQLVRSGIMIDGAARDARYMSAEYVALRLVAGFQELAPIAWNNCELFRLLSQPGNQGIATGFLLETYFHVRSANWTAAPVLAHSMKTRQRELLEKFYVDERDHGEGIYTSFASLGFQVEEVRDAAASIETELFERFLYSCASRSPLEFVAALIVPEIDEASKETAAASEGTDTIRLIEEVQGLPSDICRVFRRHSQDNTELGHESLPVEFICDAEVISGEQARAMFSTLDYTIHAYAQVLDGVVRRYRDCVAPADFLKTSPAIAY